MPCGLLLPSGCGLILCGLLLPSGCVPMPCGLLLPSGCGLMPCGRPRRAGCGERSLLQIDVYTVFHAEVDAGLIISEIDIDNVACHASGISDLIGPVALNVDPGMHGDGIGGHRYADLRPAAVGTGIAGSHIGSQPILSEISQGRGCRRCSGLCSRSLLSGKPCLLSRGLLFGKPCLFCRGLLFGKPGLPGGKPCLFVIGRILSRGLCFRIRRNFFFFEDIQLRDRAGLQVGQLLSPDKETVIAYLDQIPSEQ